MISTLRATSLLSQAQSAWFTVHTPTSPQPHSSKFSFSSLSHILFLLSQKPPGTSTFLTGVQSPSMSTSTCSTSELESMVSSQELTTCLMSTHLMVPTPSALSPSTSLNTSTGSITMTISETLVHQTPREMMTTSSSKSSQDSQSSASGKPTGIKVTTCQPSSISSKT